MAKKKMVNVDFQKGEAVRIDHGMDYTTFSERMGHSRSWWSGVKMDKKMSATDSLLFRELFGVDITVKNYDKATPTQDASPDIDWDKLAGIVAKAIDYGRLGDVMRQVIDYDKLSDAVCKAMVKALEGDSKDIVDPEENPVSTFVKRKLE